MKYDLRIRDSFGHLLEVLQELPDKGDKFPTIVMVPGFGMDLHEYGYFDEVSKELVRHGFQTFRFSFEGTGKSEGNFVEMTVDKQAKQIHDLLDYIKKDRFTNIRKIGVLAQSFGGVTVITAFPFKTPKSYLFTSVPAHPVDSLSKWFKRQRGFRPEGISEIERSDKRKSRVGPLFWKSLLKHNLLEEIKILKQPILFIHGGKDNRIKVWEAEEYFNAVSSRKKLHIIDRADHAFTGKYRPKVVELVVEWFNETLR